MLYDVLLKKVCIEKSIENFKMALEGNRKSFKYIYGHYYVYLISIFERTNLDIAVYKEVLHESLFCVLGEYKKTKENIEEWSTLEMINNKVTLIFKDRLANYYFKIQPKSIDSVWEQVATSKFDIDDWLESELNSVDLVPVKSTYRGKLEPLSLSEIENHIELGEVSDFEEYRVSPESNKSFKTTIKIKSIKRGTP